MVQALMSAENEQRARAEAALGELKKHPDACVSQMLRGLRASPSLETRALCAVLLRKVRRRRTPLLQVCSGGWGVSAVGWRCSPLGSHHPHPPARPATRPAGPAQGHHLALALALAGRQGHHQGGDAQRHQGGAGPGHHQEGARVGVAPSEGVQCGVRPVGNIRRCPAASRRRAAAPPPRPQLLAPAPSPTVNPLPSRPASRCATA
jgi:hypothetical protein